jgi:acetyl esterase/lipase
MKWNAFCASHYEIYKTSLNQSMKYLLFFSILLFFSSCKGDLDLIVPERAPGLSSPGEVPLIYEEKIDISYGRNVLQNYDLYLPSTRNNRNPVIVLLHPGAWRIGDKAAINSIVKRLIDKRVNCAIVNANYRLTSSIGITYAEQIQDINTLLIKLKNESNTLNISSNFLLVGISAGGHLAMLYANSPLGDKLAVGVAGIVPPVNLTSPTMYDGTLKADVQKLIGKPFSTNSEQYFKASPIFQFTQGSPPMIVFFGGKDETVPIDQAEICNKMFTVSRMNSEYNFYPTQSHDWNLWDGTLNKIITFASKNL